MGAPRRGKIRYTRRVMNADLTGFREVEHTADWELHVWAPDLPELLRQAARGMYALSHTRLAPGPRLEREFAFPYSDPENLIVDFLSELLYFGEEEGIGFDEFQIELTGTSCKFRVCGAPVEAQSKEIKAVTFHGLEVRETQKGLEANIVFDV